MLLRALGLAGSVSGRPLNPGDLLANGESFSTIAGDSNQTLTALAIATGIINRTGPTAGRTDTTDTAENVLNALAGNDPDRNVLQGVTFRLIFRNSVAFLITWAHGRGWIAGTGLLNVTASLVREYVCEILNGTKESTATSSTTGANAIVTLATPVVAGTITPGQLASGTGITAGSRVAGVTYGDTVNRTNTDKITSVTLDQNTASSQSSTLVTFSPCLRINSVGERTL